MNNSILGLINNNRPSLRDIQNREELWGDKIKIFAFAGPWNKNYNSLPNYPIWKSIRDSLLKVNEKEEKRIEEIKEELKEIAKELQNKEIEGENEEEKAKRIKFLQRLVDTPNLINWKELIEFYPSLVEEINKELVKDWEDNLNIIYQDYQPARIVYSENNVLTFATKNYRVDKNGKNIIYDLADPSLAIFYQKRLYFITNFRYVNTRTLHVEIEVKLDTIFSYYPNLLLSPGLATIEKTNLFKNSLQPCYSFCQYTDNEVSYEVPNGFSWQPKFSIWEVDTLNPFNKYTREEIDGDGFSIPVQVGVKKFLDGDNRDWADKTWEFVQDNFLQGEKHVFIAPREYGKKSTENTIYSDWVAGELVLPDVFQEQPHLIMHSRLQFYFLATPLYVGELNRCDIIAKEIRKNKVYSLRYVIRIKASPAGIFYVFISGAHTFRWKVVSQQTFKHSEFLKKSLSEGVSWLKWGWNQLKEIGSILRGGGTSNVPDNQEELNKLKIKLTKLKLIEKTSKISFSGMDFLKSVGFNITIEEKENQASLEKQGSRLPRKGSSKNANDKKEKSKVEIADFYANLIGFMFNLHIFASQYGNPLFNCKFTWSNTLYNYLINATNKTHSVNLPVEFRNFATILRPGFNQGEAILFNDREPFGAKGTTLIKLNLRSHVGFMSNIYRKGFYLVNSVDQLKNPQLRWLETTGNINYYEDRNIVHVDETTSTTKTFVKKNPFDPEQRAYSHETYFRFTSKAVQEQFRTVVGNEWSHYDDITSDAFPHGRGFCWGCSYDALEKLPPITHYKIDSVKEDCEAFGLLRKGIKNLEQQKAAEEKMNDGVISRGSVLLVEVNKPANYISVKSFQITHSSTSHRGSPMPTDQWQPSAWGGLDIPDQPMDNNDIMHGAGGTGWTIPLEGIIGSGGGLFETLQQETQDQEFIEESPEQIYQDQGQQIDNQQHHQDENQGGQQDVDEYQQVE